MDKISAYILTNQEHTREVIKLYLDEFGGFELSGAFSSFSDVYENVLSADKALLIVDVSSDFDNAISLITKVTQNSNNCKVMAVCDMPSVNQIVKAMRAGAKEFLPSPIIKNEFFDALSRFNQYFTGNNAHKNNCRVVTVFSNKGGIGKTSIASNLALELAKITKENVALVDLNFQSGDITTFMDLKPSFNISYMLENLEKINKDFLLSTLEKYKNTSLYVLADPPFFKQAQDISPKKVSKLFDILRDTFSYIVVDAEAGFEGRTVSALDNSDIILLTTIVNLPALRNCQRCLDLFDKLGYASEKSQIVINRYMENDEIKAEDVEELLNKKIYWKVPNNYFTMMSAINKGVLVSENSPSSNVAESYKELAMQVSDTLYRQNLVRKLNPSAVENFDNLLK